MHVCTYAKLKGVNTVVIERKTVVITKKIPTITGKRMATISTDLITQSMIKQVTWMSVNRWTRRSFTCLKHDTT